MNKEKVKNKKLIIIIISILILITILGVAVFLISRNKQGKPEKTDQIYTEISQANQITFTRELDENNAITIARSGKNAYKEEKINGKTKKYIVKEGNTYYLDEDNKKYYIYNNNDSILTEIEEKLEALQETDKNNISGTEMINWKRCNYEEFVGFQDFLINTDMALKNENEAKTRFYYNNDELIYIKTLVGDKEELLNVKISYNNIEESAFTIPDDYTNGQE